MAESMIYLGPTINGLIQNAVFTGGIPATVNDLQQARPEITWLLVPISQAANVRASAQRSGTPEYSAYIKLGGSVELVKPDTNSIPSRTLTGPVDVTLQDGVTSPGNGTAYTPTSGNALLTFSIRGSSSSKTVVFEMADFSGVFAPVNAFNVLNQSRMANQTTNGNDTSPESWQVEVPAGFSFRARVSSLSGGNVKITGKAVI